MPNEVERLLDLLHERDHRVEQKRKPDRPEHADVRIVDELDDPLTELICVCAERRQQAMQHRRDLVVHPERLQHREAQREQGDERQQRGIDEAHGPQGELPVDHVPEKHHREASQPQAAPLSGGHGVQSIAPDPGVHDLEKMGSDPSSMLCCLRRVSVDHSGIWKALTRTSAFAGAITLFASTRQPLSVT